MLRLCIALTAVNFGLATAPASPPITAAAFTPDGQLVIVGSQAGISVCSWPEFRDKKLLGSKLSNVHDLAFSPRADLLLACGGQPAEAGQVELLRWPGGELAGEVAAGDDVVYDVQWRSDGGAFAAACGDRRVRMYDHHGKLLRVLEGHSQAVTAVRFLADSVIVSASRDQSVRLWDAESGRALRTLDNHTAAVVGLSVRPGTSAGTQPWIASIGADRTLRLWQPTIGRLVRFARLPREPLAVEWTADGKLVVAACEDGHVRAIDPNTAEIVKDQPALDGWAYTLIRSRDGSFLVAGGGGQLRRVLP